MQERIYIVKDNQGNQKLVSASSQSAAIRHVVNALYTAKAARPSEVAALMSAGAKVEDATPDKAPAQAAAGNDQDQTGMPE